MNIKYGVVIALVLAILFSFGSCTGRSSSGDSADYQSGYEAGYDAGKESGYESGYGDAYIELDDDDNEKYLRDIIIQARDSVSAAMDELENGGSRDDVYMMLDEALGYLENA